VYNSKHGILINKKYLDYNLLNATAFYIILTSTNTLYLAVDGLSFADIIYKASINLTFPMRLTFDSRYSDSIDIFEMRLIEKIPTKTKGQLSFYDRAPST
jgi:hypothetical protein